MKRYRQFIVITMMAIFMFMTLNQQVNAEKTTVTATKQGVGIHFIEQDWSKALQEARLRHLPIFFDAKTSWCPPCKMLAAKTFKNTSVEQFFNTNFINVSVDMEKGIGLQLAKKYAVDAYPTLIITDENANPITYTKGFMEPEQLLAFGRFGLKKFRSR